MNDQQFPEHFEANSLSTFPHHHHIRIAWLDLCVYELEEGINIFGQASSTSRWSKERPAKYHEAVGIPYGLFDVALPRC